MGSRATAPRPPPPPPRAARQDIITYPPHTPPRPATLTAALPLSVPFGTPRRVPLTPLNRLHEAEGRGATCCGASRAGRAATRAAPIHPPTGRSKRITNSLQGRPRAQQAASSYLLRLGLWLGLRLGL